MKELKSLNRVIDSFSKLPSIGHKSAERMAYALLKMDDYDIKEFANSIIDLKSKIHQCPICGLYTENNLCDICMDNDRDKKTIIVISYPKDAINFERIGTYKGSYHVLNGNISALKGIGVEDLNIASLLNRIKTDDVNEIILATDATIDGETTAMYIAKILVGQNVNVTRLAYGLPIGGHLDYADTLTISKALEGRKKI